MQNPLRSHIIYLENTIQSLRNRLTGSDLTIEEIEDIELQLSLSESALDHYRRAYALELKISGSEPPNHPTEIGGSDGGGGGESLNVIKKKEGLVGVEGRVCGTFSFNNLKFSTRCRHLPFARQTEPRLSDLKELACGDPPSLTTSIGRSSGTPVSQGNYPVA